MHGDDLTMLQSTLEIGPVRRTRLKSSRHVLPSIPSIILGLLAILSSSANGFELKPTTLLTKKAVLGHSVHLPCELPSLPDNPQLILWLKNQNTKPFYSYDARERLSGPRKQNQSDLQKRSSFTYNKKSYGDKVVLGHLRVSNVTQGDSGNYTCRVDFLKAQTKIARLKLDIIEPIWRLSVTDSHGREVGRETAPLEEEDRLHLTCKALGGRPPPTVEWISDGRILSSSNDFQNHVNHHTIQLPRWESSFDVTIPDVQAVLKVSSLRREDLGRVFTCRANNSNLVPQKTRSVKLNMSLKPAHIEIESARSPLWAGKEVEFVCKSWGSRPAAELKWFPENVFKMQSSQEALNQNSTSSRARLIPSPEDDGRIINCTASNPLVPYYSISTNAVLNVHYPPQVETQLASFLNPLNIKEGDDVYFECKVKANPPPKTLVWYHNNEEIEEDRVGGRLVQGRNLVLQKVSRNSRGLYKCIVGNAIGTVSSTPVKLDIMFAPECRQPQNMSVSILVDEEVRLNCSIDSFPSPVDYLWRVNGSNGWEKVDPSKIRSKEFSSQFLFSQSKGRQEHVTFYDNTASLDSDHFMRSNAYKEGLFKAKAGALESFATVYCLATNDVGRQREPCVFQILPAGPPGDLVSCTLINQSATTLEVACVAGHDGGLRQQFHAKVMDESGKRVITTLSSSTPKFTINGLQSGKDYLVIVTASNAKGQSQPYFLEGFALKVAENKISEDPPSHTESSILGLFLGVVFGVILVTILLYLFARSHCKKYGKNDTHKIANKRSVIDESTLEPLSPSSECLREHEPTENAMFATDKKMKGPDLTAQTPDSILSDRTFGSDDLCKKLHEDVLSSPASASTPPPPLLGLSNTYTGGGGIPRSASSHNPSSRSSSRTTTLPRNPRALQQPLHSEELSKMSSNAKKYYTLKINCTRQNNESFV